MLCYVKFFEWNLMAASRTVLIRYWCQILVQYQPKNNYHICGSHPDATLSLKQCMMSSVFEALPFTVLCFTVILRTKCSHLGFFHALLPLCSSLQPARSLRWLVCTGPACGHRRNRVHGQSFEYTQNTQTENKRVSWMWRRFALKQSIALASNVKNGV